MSLKPSTKGVVDGGRSVPKEVVSGIRKASKLVILTHENPDGDALGAARAIQLSFPDKNVTIHTKSALPSIFCEILQRLTVSAVLPDDADAALVLDCSDLKRTGYAAEIESLSRRGVPIITIDHHRAGSLEGISTVYWRDTLSASTTEMIWKCLKELRANITPEIANSILLGLFTDTGGFQHTNTSGDTLCLVSRLIAAGADLGIMHKALTTKRSLPKIKLWGSAFTGLFINRVGMAIAVVKESDLSRSGAAQDDIAGLANSLTTLEGVNAAAVFIESAKGWRVSLRAKASTNLGRLAGLYGGQGRGKSAGFMATNEQINGKIR